MQNNTLRLGNGDPCRPIACPIDRPGEDVFFYCKHRLSMKESPYGQIRCKGPGGLMLSASTEATSGNPRTLNYRTRPGH